MTRVLDYSETATNWLVNTSCELDGAHMCYMGWAPERIQLQYDAIMKELDTR